MEHYRQILEEAQKEFQIFQQQEPLPIPELVKALRTSERWMKTLNTAVQTHGFDRAVDECHFFKHVKPQLEQAYIFYYERLRMERHPEGLDTDAHRHELITYYETYFQENFEFYLYYVQGLVIFDEQYFLRGKESSRLYQGITYYSQSAEFSTNRDGCVAILLAYERVLLWLRETPGHSPTSSSRATSALTWTATKVDLVELIYALHTAGVFNRGAADLKQIVAVFEQSFQIKLGDVYRSFLEIRSRKMDATKFLSSLKHLLQRRMYEADE